MVRKRSGFLLGQFWPNFQVKIPFVLGSVSETFCEALDKHWIFTEKVGWLNRVKKHPGNFSSIAPENSNSLKERIVCQPSFFRGYVKFRGCIWIIDNPKSKEEQKHQLAAKKIPGNSAKVLTLSTNFTVWILNRLNRLANCKPEKREMNIGELSPGSWAHLMVIEEHMFVWFSDI